MKKLFIIPLLFVLGCATSFDLTKKTIDVGGKEVTYVMADTKDHSGLHFRALDRYQKDDKGNQVLTAHDTASGPGILPSTTQNLAGNAVQGAALLGAAHILKQSMSSTLNTP
jgi:hypothetical protein